jgi:hypothetical protein
LALKISTTEAKRLLLEAALLEPEASFVRERLKRPSPKHPSKGVHRGARMTLCCHVSSGLATARQARLRQSILQRAFSGKL